MKITPYLYLILSRFLFRFYPNTPAYFGWQTPKAKAVRFLIKISISGPYSNLTRRSS